MEVFLNFAQQELEIRLSSCSTQTFSHYTVLPLSVNVILSMVAHLEAAQLEQGGFHSLLNTNHPHKMMTQPNHEAQKPGQLVVARLWGLSILLYG